MPQNPPQGYPRVMPYLLYEDSDAALEFLVSAFGFTEKMRLTGENGRINHAELSIGDGVIMFGTPDGEYKNPNKLGGRTGNIYVYVDDVDAHYERAKQAGATIAREPEDQFYGDRNYLAHDPEGHEWYFATHVREMSEDEMQSAGVETN
jgi:PhnB protein